VNGWETAVTALAIGAGLAAPDWVRAQACEPGTLCSGGAAATDPIDAQPLAPARDLQAMDSRNRAAFEAYRARMADYQAKQAAYESQNSAAGQAYAATLAAHQATLADWQARVKACHSGDASQCAH